MKKKSKLSPNERDKIALLKASGHSLSQIAKELGRSKSTISEEVKRNSWQGNYVAITAQIKSDKRKKTGRYKNRHPLKNPTIFAYVLEKLSWGWSPEQIAGRLELENGHKMIHHETIYDFIYQPENKRWRLWEKLPWKRKKRHKKQGRKVQRTRIPSRVSIHLRDKSIEKRETFGHWEGDTIIGRQTRGKVIHTEVERQTRFLVATILNSKSAKETIEVQKRILSQYQASSETMDNGNEFVEHQQLNLLGIKTYFADPYSSWQRGTNENTNGLIRRYLPKKTNFEDLSQDDLNDIVEEINNRPRKCLRYHTPWEVLHSELIIKGVRIKRRM